MSDPSDNRHYTAQTNWQSPEAAAAYSQARDPSRFHRYALEEKIVNNWLADLRQGSLVLDIPCGAGRLSPTIARKNLRYIGGDFSLAMIDEARKVAASNSTIGFVNADASRMPFRDGAVDCVIIWRLLHHVRHESVRQQMLREAARVSRYKVLVSFHHPLSFTFARKFLQRKFFGRSHGQAITHWRLKREARSCGLELVETAGFRKYVSLNWFACLIKPR